MAFGIVAFLQDDLSEEFGEIGIRRNQIGVVCFSTFCLSVIMAVACAVFLSDFGFFLPLFFASLAIPFVFIGILGYRKDLKEKELEENLPRALFQMASFSSRTSFEKMVEKIAASDYGLLSKMFSRVRSSMAKGMPVPDAFDSVARGSSKSKILRKAFNLISQAHASGGNFSHSFKSIAGSIFSILSLEKEVRAQSAMLKYTLIIGNCLLMPASIGFVFNISTSLAELDVSTVSFELPLAVNVYIFLTLLASSILIGLQEGSLGRFVVYFALMVPISFAVFCFASSFKF